MLTALRTLWTRHRWLTLAFAAAMLVTVAFGIGAIRHAPAWRAPPDQPIAGWMTPRYVAHSWDLPRDVMIDALRLDPDARPGPRSLDRIAKDQGVPVQDLVDRLDAAIAAHRAGRE